jgi:hypothetical protein
VLYWRDSNRTGDVNSTELNLTGVWQGLYSYPRKLEPVSFVATLIERGSCLSGSIHEAAPARFRHATVFASLLGSRSAGAVTFVKTYMDGIPHRRPITYEGAVLDDGSEIDGRWTLAPEWSGRFLMIRETRNAESVVRRKYERVRG